ncbi:MAG: hypothetical protein ACR2NP_14935, partial [Pirellulaceae bacterium]
MENPASDVAIAARIGPVRTQWPGNQEPAKFAESLKFNSGKFDLERVRIFNFLNLPLPPLPMLRHAACFLTLALTAGAVRAEPVQENSAGYSFVAEESVWRPQIQGGNDVAPQDVSEATPLDQTPSVGSNNQFQSTNGTASQFDQPATSSAPDFGALDRETNPG